MLAAGVVDEGVEAVEEWGEERERMRGWESVVFILVVGLVVEVVLDLKSSIVVV